MEPAEAGETGAARPAVEPPAGSRREADASHDHDLAEVASSPSGDPVWLVGRAG